MSSTVAQALQAIREGQPVVLPFDTVYGLCADPQRAEPVQRAYALKGREAGQPSALVASSVDYLFECLPELRGRAGERVRALLPGPYTLVVPNPARRYRWLAGGTPEAIGIRVPALAGPGAEVLEQAGALMATSANLTGEADPCRLDELPWELRAGCGAVVDGGELPGVPSTVLELLAAEPRVLRAGAVPAAEALERLASLID